MNRAKMRAWWRLDEHTCAESDCPPPPMAAAEGWEECPEQARARPAWRIVVELWNASTVGSLDGWPQGWAAWVVDGMRALHEADAARQRNEAATMAAQSKGAAQCR